MRKSVAAGLGVVTFAGASVGAVFVGSSYPVAIWGVGFAVLYKVFHKEVHECPLARIAATAEDGEGRVVAKVAAGYRKD